MFSTVKGGLSTFCPQSKTIWKKTHLNPFSRAPNSPKIIQKAPKNTQKGVYKPKIIMALLFQSHIHEEGAVNNFFFLGVTIHACHIDQIIFRRNSTNRFKTKAVAVNGLTLGKEAQLFF